VNEVFLNVTPLHRAELYIQTELNKLQASVSRAPHPAQNTTSEKHSLGKSPKTQTLRQISKFNSMIYDVYDMI